MCLCMVCLFVCKAQLHFPIQLPCKKFNCTLHLTLMIWEAMLCFAGHLIRSMEICFEFRNVPIVMFHANRHTYTHTHPPNGECMHVYLFKLTCITIIYSFYSDSSIVLHVIRWQTQQCSTLGFSMSHFTLVDIFFIHAFCSRFLLLQGGGRRLRLKDEISSLCNRKPYFVQMTKMSGSFFNC